MPELVASYRAIEGHPEMARGRRVCTGPLLFSGIPRGARLLLAFFFFALLLVGVFLLVIRLAGGRLRLLPTWLRLLRWLGLLRR